MTLPRSSALMLAASIMLHVAVADPADTGSASAAPAASPSPFTITVKGATISDTRSGFALTLPGPHWTAHTRAGSPIGVPSSDAELTSKNGGFAVVMCEDATLATAAYAKPNITTFAQGATDYKEVSRSETTVAGSKAIQIIATARIEDSPVRYLMTYVCSRRCHQLVCWSPESLWEDDVADFRSLVASFGEPEEPGNAAPVASPGPSPSAAGGQ